MRCDAAAPRRCASFLARCYTERIPLDALRSNYNAARFSFSYNLSRRYVRLCVLFGLDPSGCYGSTTTNEDDDGDNDGSLLLKSALDEAYERMRLRGGLPPHINVASLHRLLMPGSGVPPPRHRFGWSTGGGRRHHHRLRRYRRRRRYH